MTGDVEPVQTLSQIRALLAGAGVRPKHRLGQNFLVDGNLMRLLVDRACIRPDQTVLEIGCGTGSLTALLALRARRVIAVECDLNLLAIAHRQVPAQNVVWIGADALEGPHRLSAELRVALQQFDLDPWSLVANLPYRIASPLIALLVCLARPPSALTFMVQSEVADRITASPGTRQYGPLSVLIQALCETRWLRDVPPSAFWPRPKVGSAILRLTPRPHQQRRAVRLESLQWVVRRLFASRRKTLRALLKHADLPAATVEAVETAVLACGADLSWRAEQMTASQFVAVAARLAQHDLSG